MSTTGLPARRTTRSTRVVVKEDENANTRPSRIVTRSKPGAKSSTTTVATSNAKQVDLSAQGKRKREALGELTSRVANKDKSHTADLKGKGKDGDSLKPTKTAPVLRPPLRVVRKKLAATSEKAGKDEEDAMAVDHPVPVVLVPHVPKAIAERSTRSRVSTSTSRSHNNPVASRTVFRKVDLEDNLETVEEEPLHKKRKTSPELGDDDQVEDLEDGLVDAEGDIEQFDEADDGWEDLDKDDFDDPMQASEYVGEIFDYLKKIEQSTMPNPNYMRSQVELAWKMRGILIDWLIQLHTRFRLVPETLFLCVNLIDRFLSARVVSLAKLQLVGVTCMFIAAKVEDTVAPTVANFVYCADSSYKEAEILQAEKYVLKTIDWNLSYPSPLNFLRRISKADDYNPETRTLGKYFLEIGCLEWRLLAAPSSLMAAASMWLARLVLDFPEWTPNLRHYSSYPESAIIPTANIILNYLLKPVVHQSFFKKYSSKKFMKASIYARDWCLQRWPERTNVDLVVELPALKELARKRRAESEPEASEEQ